MRSAAITFELGITFSPECAINVGNSDDRKVVMILSSRRCSFLPLVAVLAMPLGAARADEAAHFIQVDMHCSLYGPSFVDLGNGVCGPVSGRVRAEPAGHATEPNGWTSNATSTAALRTDGIGMVPGAGDARHLRIQSGTDLYGR